MFDFPSGPTVQALDKLAIALEHVIDAVTAVSLALSVMDDAPDVRNAPELLLAAQHEINAIHGMMR